MVYRSAPVQRSKLRSILTTIYEPALEAMQMLKRHPEEQKFPLEKSELPEF
jgi:hypothetical protein